MAVSKVSVEDPEAHEHVAQVGHAQEGLAPRAGAVASAGRGLVGLAAVRAAQLERAREVVADVVVGGLEAEHEHRALAVAGAGLLRLERVDQPAVGGAQAGLHDRPHRLGAGQEGGEAHRRARPGATGAAARAPTPR